MYQGYKYQATAHYAGELSHDGRTEGEKGQQIHHQVNQLPIKDMPLEEYEMYRMKSNQP